MEHGASSPGAHELNPRRILTALLTWSSAVLVVTASATAALIILTDRHSWWSGWLAAIAISMASTLASMAVLSPSIFGGMQTAAYGYLAASVVRMLAALISCIAAIWILRLPAVPTLIVIIPLYFAQLATEAFVVGRAFWSVK